MTLAEIEKYVIENGFGTEKREKDFFYWSAGVRYAYDSDPELWRPYIDAALEQVNNEDYGGFYEWDEEPTPGREYYLCKSPYGNDIDTGIVIHKENGLLIMYFQFER